MFQRRYLNVLVILLFMATILACKAPDLAVAIYNELTSFENLSNSYTKDECLDAGWDWYYNDIVAGWVCDLNRGPKKDCLLEGKTWVPETRECVDPLNEAEAGGDPALSPGEEHPAPAVAPEGDQPVEVSISDLAGTYVGTTNFLDFHVDDWGGGAITQNEITITIFEDGTVDGIFIVIFESSQKSNESCVWHVLRTQSGTIFGQISQSTGTVKFDYTWKQELFRNCLGGNATTVNDHQDEFHINISGNTMTGSGDGSKTFEATKK
jgi:hypothetical protein